MTPSEIKTRLKKAATENSVDRMEAAVLCRLAVERIVELEETLKGVVRVADRRTVEFDRARDALNGVDA